MNLYHAMRRAILLLADSPTVRRVVKAYGMKLGAARFVAGETPEAGVTAAKELNASGLKVTLDHLGESVNDAGQAQAAASAYLQILDLINLHRLDANVSLKLTQMGLLLDEQACLQNVRRVVAHAAALGNFVRIDMEQSDYVDATLRIYKQLRQNYDNVGVVIQAYLYRSESDLGQLAQMAANVRLVKGAYDEPETMAFQVKADVEKNFRKLIAFYLQKGLYTAVATHDEQIITYTRDLTRRLRIDQERFEFQFLYGMRPQLQTELARTGYQVRVYVPYGSDWYPYLMRRLAERPGNLSFLLRNLLRA